MIISLEAGFAKGIEIEVIFTYDNEDSNNIHFDLRHLNFIFWHKEELDKHWAEEKLTPEEYIAMCYEDKKISKLKINLMPYQEKIKIEVNIPASSL